MLTGGSENDELHGDSGNDRLFGNSGEDELYGGYGKDWLYGGSNNDYLHGGEQDDVLYGEGGNDHLVGNEGNDTLRGGEDDDTLKGNSGENQLWGGTGSDSFIFYNDFAASADTIHDFEDGVDQLIFINPTGYSTDSIGFDDLTITNVNGGAEINYDSGSIMLNGISASDLTVDDFAFG